MFELNTKHFLIALQALSAADSKKEGPVGTATGPEQHLGFGLAMWQYHRLYLEC